jgi:hypothetical protein
MPVYLALRRIPSTALCEAGSHVVVLQASCMLICVVWCSAREKKTPHVYTEPWEAQKLFTHK